MFFLMQLTSDSRITQPLLALLLYIYYLSTIPIRLQRKDSQFLL